MSGDLGEQVVDDRVCRSRLLIYGARISNSVYPREIQTRNKHGQIVMR